MADESNEQPEVHDFLGKQWREISESEFYANNKVPTMRTYVPGRIRFFAEIVLPTEPGMYLDAESNHWKRTDTRWIPWNNRNGDTSDWGTPSPVGLRRMEPVA